MKKNNESMSDIAIGGMIGLNVVGALPSTAGDTGIRTGFATGVSNVGTALPVMGKIKGTTMVVKSVKKLKPFKFKGGFKL